MSIAGMSLEAVGAALAARTPVPGGGAVAAVTASHAAALLAMVVEFTRGKPAFAAHEAALAAALERSNALRHRLLALADADASAYAALNALWRLPKDAPERVAGWQPAVRAAIDAPQGILAAAAEIAALAADLKARTNPALASDLAIALDLARTAARAAAHNVEVNLPSLHDPAECAEAEARMRTTLARALT